MQSHIQVSMDEIAQTMVDPSIACKMMQGFFERVKEPTPPVQRNILSVSCVDSRLLPALVLGHEHGEAYAVQTVANVVPRIDLSASFGDQPIEVAAALQYAVEHKAIKEIVIVGHTHCGGAEARVMRDPSLPNVNGWMSHVRLEGLPDQLPPEIYAAMDSVPMLRTSALRHAENECLRTSIENIRALPFIETAIRDTRLSLAGLICDMDKGRLKIPHINETSLPAVTQLVKGFKRFKADVWGENGRMHDLVANGQHPKALILTGISPYVAPERVFGIEPGDAFVHRRIGGHYHHERTPGGLAATIEFAVKAKRVGSIVLVGHRNDVNLDYALGKMDQYDLVRAFMEKSTPELRAWRKAGMNPDILHEKSMRSTHFNVMAHPDVEVAIDAGRLSVLTMLVDHQRGTLEVFDPRTNDFMQARPPA